MEDFDFEVLDISVLATTKFFRIGDILAALQLSHWEETFLSEEIDTKTFFFLTDKHLSLLGLSLRERVKFLRCIQLFKDTPLTDKFTPPPLPIPTIPKSSSSSSSTSSSKPIPDPIKETTTLPPPPPPPAMTLPPPLPPPSRPRIRSAIPDPDPQTPHSLCFILYDLTSSISFQHANLLEESFKTKLLVDRVNLHPFENPEEGALIPDEVGKIINICSHANDDLLWFILLGTSPEVNELVQPCVDTIFQTYMGKRVFFMLDSVDTNFAEVLQFTPARFSFSVLSCSFPRNGTFSVNPQYVSLCLLDTLRENFVATESALTLERFVDEVFANLEFLERCSETSLVVNYLPGEESDPVQQVVLLPPTKTEEEVKNRYLGMRGITQDRPIQIVKFDGEFAVVRFLEEYSQPGLVKLEEILLDEEEATEEEVEPALLQRTLPIPEVEATRNLIIELHEEKEDFPEEEMQEMVLEPVDEKEEPVEVLQEVVALENVHEEEFEQEPAVVHAIASSQDDRMASVEEMDILQEESMEPMQEESSELIREESMEPMQEVSSEFIQEESMEPMQEVSSEFIQEESMEPMREMSIEQIEPMQEEFTLEPEQELPIEPLQEESIEPLQELSIDPEQDLAMEPILREESIELMREVSIEPAVVQEEDYTLFDKTVEHEEETHTMEDFEPVDIAVVDELFEEAVHDEPLKSRTEEDEDDEVFETSAELDQVFDDSEMELDVVMQEENFWGEEEDLFAPSGDEEDNETNFEEASVHGFDENSDVLDEFEEEKELTTQG